MHGTEAGLSKVGIVEYSFYLVYSRNGRGSFHLPPSIDMYNENHEDPRIKPGFDSPTLASEDCKLS